MPLVSANTQLFGLIGWPVGHSKSPAMHNAAAADLGLDLIYVPLPVQPHNLSAAIGGLSALGFLGANVTVPHKEAVLPLIDVIDPAAQVIGAVNTIVVSRQGATRSGQSAGSNTDLNLKLIGYNTDWSGFMADLAELGVETQDQECLILGAGGSARAVAYGLASAGSLVHILARRKEQAETLVNTLSPHCPDGRFMAHPWDSLDKAGNLFAAVRLIVNCTPIGMSPHGENSPWPRGLPFPEQAFIYDLVYSPSTTKLMRQGLASKHRVSNGLGTLARQGAQAFYLWTGKHPQLHVMINAATASAGAA